MLLKDYKVSKFYGLNTNIKDQKTLKAGWATDVLNWLVSGKEGDRIELRRGYKLLGQTRNEDADGKITGLGVGLKYDGSFVPFFSFGKKVKYYDVVTDDVVEIGTDLLGDDADGEDVWFEKYQNLAGSFMYLGSPNSGIFKIVVANPDTAIDQEVQNHRFGVWHVGVSRSFAGQRNGLRAGNNDKTGVYVSYIDRANLSDYTQVTGEAFGTGDGSTTDFNYTLSAITGVRTAMYASVHAPIGAGVDLVYITGATNTQIGANAHGFVEGDMVVVVGAGGMTQINNLLGVVTNVLSADVFEVDIDGSAFTAFTSGGKVYRAERFVDDRNGVMIGTEGGEGTIDYAMGEIDLSFATAPINGGLIKVSYYWEDATDEGVLDYTPGGAGEGKSFRQDSAGSFMAIFNLNLIEYCFHLLKTWQLTMTLDDTNSTNLEYRNIGIPYPRAAAQAPEGILFADLARPNDPKFRRLEVLQGTNSTTIEPKSISDYLDISSYTFDYCVAFRWGDYEIFCVQESVNGTPNPYNTVMFIRNVLSGAWSKLDYYVSCLAIYNGTLIAGDSLSNNVYTLFSGYDEDGDVITNYYTTEDSNLGTEQMKSVRRMVINGLIQPNQKLKVSVSYDNAAFVEVYRILGNASYVDSGINTYIGGATEGSHVIGGGGDDTAHPFEVDFPINSPRFTNVKLRFEALDVGFVAVNDYEFKDIRDKGRKRLPIRTI